MPSVIPPSAVRLYQCWAADAASGRPWSRASPPVSFPYPSLPLIAVCLLSRETTGFRCDSAGMHIWLLVLSGRRGRRARRCRDSRACTAALQLWESGRSARVAVGVGRGTPPEKPGPNVRFLHGSHGHGWMCRQVPAPSGETCQTPRDSMWVPLAAEKPVRVSYQLLAHRCAVWMLQDDAVPDTRDSHRSLLDVDRLVPWIGRRPLVLYCRLSIFCSGPLRHIRDFQRRRPCHVN